MPPFAVHEMTVPHSGQGHSKLAVFGLLLTTFMEEDELEVPFGCDSRLFHAGFRA